MRTSHILATLVLAATSLARPAFPLPPYIDPRNLTGPGKDLGHQTLIPQGTELSGGKAWHLGQAVESIVQSQEALRELIPTSSADFSVAVDAWKSASKGLPRTWATAEAASIVHALHESDNAIFALVATGFSMEDELSSAFREYLTDTKILKSFLENVYTVAGVENPLSESLDRSIELVTRLRNPPPAARAHGNGKNRHSRSEGPKSPDGNVDK